MRKTRPGAVCGTLSTAARLAELQACAAAIGDKRRRFVAWQFGGQRAQATVPERAPRLVPELTR